MVFTSLVALSGLMELLADVNTTMTAAWLRRYISISYTHTPRTPYLAPAVTISMYVTAWPIVPPRFVISSCFREKLRLRSDNAAGAVDLIFDAIDVSRGYIWKPQGRVVVSNYCILIL
jgi:hypothetical protein